MTQAPHRTPPEHAGSIMEPPQMLTRRLAAAGFGAHDLLGPGLAEVEVQSAAVPPGEGRGGARYAGRGRARVARAGHDARGDRPGQSVKVGSAPCTTGARPLGSSQSSCRPSAVRSSRL